MSQTGNVEVGSTIIVSVKPSADYELDRLYYVVNGKQYNIDKKSKKFNMPNGDAEVCAKFKKPDQTDLEGRVKPANTPHPFKINNIEVANTCYGGSKQTDYGKPIYSPNTLYLKPRVKIECYENGSVELDTMLYWPNGSLVTTQGGNGKHKPGYTTSSTIPMNKGVQTINMRSWGGSDYQGNWMAGDYKCKIYYNGELVHEQIIHILEP